MLKGNDMIDRASRAKGGYGRSLYLGASALALVLAGQPAGAQTTPVAGSDDTTAPAATPQDTTTVAPGTVSANQQQAGAVVANSGAVQDTSPPQDDAAGADIVVTGIRQSLANAQ